MQETGVSMALTSLSPEAFAAEWIAAWNAHDIERILSHYAEDAVLVSPIVATRLGIESGRLEGKAALRAYFARGLAAYPDLRFTFRRVLGGVGSLVIDYLSADGRPAAEFMAFNAAGQVRSIHAHYAGA